MISTDEALLGFAILGSELGQCPHRQAEPVELATGETVACICISCLRQLPAKWIAWQRAQAETTARCTHAQCGTEREEDL